MHVMCACDVWRGGREGGGVEGVGKEKERECRLVPRPPLRTYYIITIA